MASYDSWLHFDYDIEQPVRPSSGPVERWLEFSFALSQDEEARALLRYLRDNDDFAYLQLGVGLGQAAKGDPATFIDIWTLLLGTGLIQPTLIAKLRALANQFDLNPAFTAALGPEPEPVVEAPAEEPLAEELPAPLPAEELPAPAEGLPIP